MHNRARPGPVLTPEPRFPTRKTVAPECAEELWQWVAHQNRYHPEMEIKQVCVRVQGTGTFFFYKHLQ